MICPALILLDAYQTNQTSAAPLKRLPDVGH
jgi:hypothetical protein